MISAMQGVSMPDISQMREKMKHMQSFQSGKINLSQDDLSNIQSDFSSKGVQDLEGIQDLIDNFQEVDTNGDGISIEELNTYTGGQGMSIMGPPPGLFNGQSQGQGEEGHRPPPPKGESASIDTQSTYLETLLESYLSSSEEEDQTQATSYFI